MSLRVSQTSRGELLRILIIWQKSLTFVLQNQAATSTIYIYAKIQIKINKSTLLNELFQFRNNRFTHIIQNYCCPGKSRHPRVTHRGVPSSHPVPIKELLFPNIAVQYPPKKEHKYPPRSPVIGLRGLFFE